MPNRFNNWEDEVLKLVPSQIEKTKGDMKSVLDEYVKAQSVTRDSLDSINGVSLETAGDFSSDGKVDTIAKVRVLTPNNGIVNGGTRADNESNSTGNINATIDYSSNNVDSDSFNINKFFNNGGSAQTLIFIYTAILVALVMLVSFIILNFING